MLDWFRALSIRWKLQFGFFIVTMITTIYSRLLASHELLKMIDIARRNGVPTEVIQQMEANHSAYIFNSFWEAGLEFGVQFIVIGLVASAFVKPITALLKSLQAVEAGDLTKGVDANARDEIGTLGHCFNDVLAKLNKIMREIDESGKRMGQSAFQIKTISHDIAEVNKKEQNRSAEVETATDALQEISQAVQTRSSTAAERTRLLQDSANQGISTVQRNIREMEETVVEVNRTSSEIAALSDAANQIHHIIDTIKEIAGQTNLLALNAAIEAARAGEQGRGFAVVADEVRKLAERTTHSAAEVSGIIAQLSQKVDQSTDAMNTVVGKVNINQQVAAETARVIESMVGGITDTAMANSGISDASRQQIEQLVRLKSTLATLFSTLGESANKVDTTAAIGDNLYGVTENLNSLMSGFIFNKDSGIAAAPNEKRRYPRVDSNLLLQVTQDAFAAEAVSKDFSLAGMSLTLPSALKPDMPLTLGIYLPSDNLGSYAKQQPLKIAARIAWQRQEGGRYQCGVQFLEMDNATRSKLKECFAFYDKSPEFTS